MLTLANIRNLISRVEAEGRYPFDTVVMSPNTEKALIEEAAAAGIAPPTTPYWSLHGVTVLVDPDCPDTKAYLYDWRTDRAGVTL